jgi:hypothetical protein
MYPMKQVCKAQVYEVELATKSPTEQVCDAELATHVERVCEAERAIKPHQSKSMT